MSDLGDQLRQVLPSEYKIEGSLGRGGQGSVFKGSFRGAPAAIKLFAPALEPERLSRELEALLHGDCAQLVRVLGTTFVQLGGVDHAVVAYELHFGGDLRAVCTGGSGSSRVDEGFLRQLGIDASTAVEWLWSKRIVHRDIKPDNIVRRAGSGPGGFVVVDVGLARHVDRSALTMPGYVVGTPGYQSPEQASGRRNLTVRSDIFSLGITLYEVAAQAHPWQGQQHLIGRVSPQSLSTLRPDLSPEFCALVHEMLTSSVGMRPAAVAHRFTKE